MGDKNHLQVGALMEREVIAVTDLSVSNFRAAAVLLFTSIIGVKLGGLTGVQEY